MNNQADVHVFGRKKKTRIDHLEVNEHLGMHSALISSKCQFKIPKTGIRMVC